MALEPAVGEAVCPVLWVMGAIEGFRVRQGRGMFKIAFRRLQCLCEAGIRNWR